MLSRLSFLLTLSVYSRVNHCTANTLPMPVGKLFGAACYNCRALLHHHHKHLLPNITLKTGNEHIKHSETIRNLGAFFDSHMTMSSHINNVTKTVTFHLRNIGRIRKYIDQTTLTMPHVH